jgi:hypothetical protein
MKAIQKSYGSYRKMKENTSKPKALNFFKSFESHILVAKLLYGVVERSLVSTLLSPNSELQS